MWTKRYGNTEWRGNFASWKSSFTEKVKNMGVNRSPDQNTMICCHEFHHKKTTHLLYLKWKGMTPNTQALNNRFSYSASSGFPLQWQGFPLFPSQPHIQTTIHIYGCVWSWENWETQNVLKTDVGPKGKENFSWITVLEKAEDTSCW